MGSLLTWAPLAAALGFSFSRAEAPTQGQPVQGHRSVLEPQPRPRPPQAFVFTLSPAVSVTRESRCLEPRRQRRPHITLFVLPVWGDLSKRPAPAHLGFKNDFSFVSSLPLKPGTLLLVRPLIFFLMSLLLNLFNSSWTSHISIFTLHAPNLWVLPRPPPELPPCQPPTREKTSNITVLSSLSGDLGVWRR